MIVRRPERETREVVESADLDPQGGLIGDNWIDRLDVEGNPKRHSQLTLMNSRVANAIATRPREVAAGWRSNLRGHESIGGKPSTRITNPGRCGAG